MHMPHVIVAAVFEELFSVIAGDEDDRVLVPTGESEMAG